MSQDNPMVIKNTTGEPTALHYAPITNPFPLQASATGKDALTAQLIITATNPDPDPDNHKVAVQGIVIQIPIGTAGNELCPDATDIHPVPPTGWKNPTIATPTGFVQYTFLPQKSPAEIGSVALQFAFNDVTINDQIGTVEIDVTEGSNNCTTPNCPVSQLFVTKFPNGWGKVSFWVDPVNIPLHGSTTLNWDGPEQATYTIQYYTPSTGIVNIPGPGKPPLAHKGQYPGQNQPPLVLNNAGQFVFTLNVAETIGGQSYQSQNQTVVTVVPPPNVTCFEGSISKSAGKLQLNLKWAAENAAYCTLTVEPDTEFTQCGSRQWPFASPQSTYTLTAVASNGATAVSHLALNWALAGSWSRSGGLCAVDLVLSPDGSRLYAANLGEVSVLTPTEDDNSPLQQTKAITDQPSNWVYTSVAISPDGSRLYVATWEIGRGSEIWVYDASSLSRIGSGVPLGVMVWNMAVSTGGNGSYLFVGDLVNSNILVFTITGDSSNPLQAFGSPVSIPNLLGLRISPDATQLYVLTGPPPRRPPNDGQFDDSRNPLQALGSPLSIPNRLGLSIISPDATQLHVPAGSAIDVYQPTDNATNPLKHIASHALGNESLRALGVAPGLKYPAAVLYYQGQVTIFDAGSMTVGAPSATIGSEDGVASIAIAPDGSRVYVGCGRITTITSEWECDTIIYALVPSGLSGGTPCT